jgi:acid stress-induced BolA-like protein IbaG/YrbA
MQIEQVKQLIEAGLPGAQVEVSGDGSHFEAIIVYDGFADKSTIKQHQMVYKTLGDSFQTNEIHALTLKTYTPTQWQTAQKLRVS